MNWVKINSRDEFETGESLLSRILSSIGLMMLITFPIMFIYAGYVSGKVKTIWFYIIFGIMSFIGLLLFLLDQVFSKEIFIFKRDQRVIIHQVCMFNRKKETSFEFIEPYIQPYRVSWMRKLYAIIFKDKNKTKEVWMSHFASEKQAKKMLEKILEHTK